MILRKIKYLKVLLLVYILIMVSCITVEKKVPLDFNYYDVPVYLKKGKNYKCNIVKDWGSSYTYKRWYEYSGYWGGSGEERKKEDTKRHIEQPSSKTEFIEVDKINITYESSYEGWGCLPFFIFETQRDILLIKLKGKEYMECIKE